MLIYKEIYIVCRAFIYSFSTEKQVYDQSFRGKWRTKGGGVFLIAFCGFISYD